jgi:DNA-directed RNA polymerase subunit RPC12/RpoP
MESNEDATVHHDMESLENETTVGYIHNVSPMKKGIFFECQLQTSTETVRAVCFSPKKRTAIVNYSENGTAVKVKKFRYETKYNSQDIVIDEHTTVDECKDITFEKKDLPDTTKTIQIAHLKSLSVGQLVTVKGKVISTKPVKNIKPTLTMREVYIVDTTGSIKLILWQEYVDNVQVGGTYNFSNVRLKKDSYTQELYINTAKNEESIITISTPFQDTLAISQEGSNSNICIKCSKKLQDISMTTETTATCTHCNIHQKKSTCRKM